MLAMRSLLRRRVGNPSATDVTDTVLTGHINDAIEEIRDKYKILAATPRARFTTGIGTARYMLSTLTDTVLKVWDRTNGKELTKVGINYVAANDNVNVTNGKPLKWGRFEDYLELFPPPDGAYVIEVLYREFYTALIADVDVPDIPAAWHRGAVILAAFNYYDVDGKDAVKSKYQMDVWKNWLQDKPVEAHEEQAAAGTGVELPTIDRGGSERLDFDHSS